MVSSTRSKFPFDFPLFIYLFVFLSLICCDVWLYHRTTIDLFIGFYDDISDDNVVSIR